MIGKYRFTDPVGEGAEECGSVGAGECEGVDGGEVGERRTTGDRPTFVDATVVRSLGLRELKLTWPGERLVGLCDLPEARAVGWVPVGVLILHGAEGSWREGGAGDGQVSGQRDAV